MLVYRLYKSPYIAQPLSAEGARRAGGRWNPKAYPILYTSATPELALLEIVAHLNPLYLPSLHLLVLDIPDTLSVSVPSAIVDRSRNYLLHTLHPSFEDAAKIVENVPFPVDSRLRKTNG